MGDSGNGLLVRLVVPCYDELSLFLMSVGFLALYAIDPVLRGEACDYVLAGFTPLHPLILLFFAAGLVFSVYHVFTRREKTEPERWLMLFFAIVVNYAASLAAGVHLWQESRGWLLVFPALNILGGLLLVVFATFRVFDERVILQENATVLQVIVGSLWLAVILAVCHLVFELYWAVTFSICVAYATMLSRTVRDLPPLPMREAEDEEQAE